MPFRRPPPCRSGCVRGGASSSSGCCVIVVIEGFNAAEPPGRADRHEGAASFRSSAIHLVGLGHLFKARPDEPRHPRRHRPRGGDRSTPATTVYDATVRGAGDENLAMFILSAVRTIRAVATSSFFDQVTVVVGWSLLLLVAGCPATRQLWASGRALRPIFVAAMFSGVRAGFVVHPRPSRRSSCSWSVRRTGRRGRRRRCRCLGIAGAAVSQALFAAHITDGELENEYVVVSVSEAVQTGRLGVRNSTVARHAFLNVQLATSSGVMFVVRQDLLEPVLGPSSSWRCSVRSCTVPPVPTCAYAIRAETVSAAISRRWMGADPSDQGRELRPDPIRSHSLFAVLLVSRGSSRACDENYDDRRSSDRRQTPTCAGLRA